MGRNQRINNGLGYVVIPIPTECTEIYYVYEQTSSDILY